VKGLPNYIKGRGAADHERRGSAAHPGQKAKICPDVRQLSCPNGERPIRKNVQFIGAGEGNRTLVFSLEGCCSTIELHPRQAMNYHAAQAVSTLMHAWGLSPPFARVFDLNRR
jgi:hypothetical protein